MRLAENNVPPSQPEPPQDPAIASMVSHRPLHVTFPLPPALKDEVFFGCKSLLACVRERKTMWTPPLPSF